MAPLLVGYRLKSPGFSDFLPYVDTFKEYLTSGLRLNASNLEVATAQWQEGPRIQMDLKIFPSNTSTRLFNRSEVFWIRDMFSGWGIPDSQVFGPYEFLSFTLTPPYADGTLQIQESRGGDAFPFLLIKFYEMKQHLIFTYVAAIPTSESGLSKGALAGVILGTIAGSVTLTAIVALLIMRRYNKNRYTYSRRRPCEYLPIFSSTVCLRVEK